MKILVFSDTHGETDFTYLEPLAKQADIILCAGDYTFFSENYEHVLEALNEFAKKFDKTMLITHGNHERSSDGEFVNKYDHLIFLHKQAFENDDMIVYGYGGGGFSKQDSEFEEFIDDAYIGVKRDKAHVWLFHGPPYDMKVDVVPGLSPTGCKSKRRMIEKHKPQLVVCGHIHDAHGETHVHDESTLVINPGPKGVLIELKKSHSNTNS